MTYEVLIQNKYRQVFEVSNLVTTANYTTNRTGSPGKLTMTIVEDGMLSFSEGSSVRFSVDGTVIFFGFVFSKSVDRWGVIEVTCYDQTRYLKANASFVFNGAQAGDVITQIATQFGLKVGVLQDTGYVIPSLIKEDKSCLDIISYAVELTTLNTGKIFVFYDDAGKLSLKSAESMKVPVVIGDKNLLTNYNYKTDIDKDTYNQIKLVRPNTETGKADTYIYKDSDTISEWGLLQQYKTVDENLNPAQITQQAQTMLKYYNRVLKNATIETLGVVGVRAGSMIMLNIPDLGDISDNKFVLLDKVTHTFENETHTMELTTRAL